jgi:hypothetical protein
LRLTTRSYRDAAEWLCSITVLEANYFFIIPHIIIDHSTLHYYYFLDKYSELTKKFTFEYIYTKEELKTAVNLFREPERQQIWILVRDLRSITEYTRSL